MRYRRYHAKAPLGVPPIVRRPSEKEGCRLGPRAPGEAPPLLEESLVREIGMAGVARGIRQRRQALAIGTRQRSLDADGVRRRRGRPATHRRRPWRTTAAGATGSATSPDGPSLPPALPPRRWPSLGLDLRRGRPLGASSEGSGSALPRQDTGALRPVFPAPLPAPPPAPLPVSGTPRARARARGAPALGIASRPRPPALPLARPRAVMERRIETASSHATAVVGRPSTASVAEPRAAGASGGPAVSARIVTGGSARAPHVVEPTLLDPKSSSRTCPSAGRATRCWPGAQGHPLRQ